MHRFNPKKLSALACLFLLSSCAGLRPLSVQKKGEVRGLKVIETHDQAKTSEVASEAPAQMTFTEALLSPVHKLAEVTANENKIEVIEETTLATEDVADIEEESELENLSAKLDPSTETTALDLELNYKEDHYKFWLNYFTKRDKERFIRHLKNGEEYREIVRAVLKEEGLPADLFYVGLIESGYNLRIKSHAAATGPWQFMKGTARQYGLRVDNAVDERYNIYKATIAAAKYFRDLYNIFGSWELALCAYNAGEYRIIRAIRKGGTRDYRELVAKKLIPKETVHYIPKVAAARELSKRREHYGINVTKKDGHFYKDTILRTVKGRFQVSKLASDLGMKLSDFKLLNPDLRHKYINTGRRGHRIVLPHHMMAKFDSGKEFKIRYAKAQRDQARFHKVRRGENLTLIAKRYGTSVASLKKYNRLKGDMLFVGQKIKLASGAQTREVAGNKQSGIIHYKVRRGDNLSTIAAKFGTSYHGIKRLNSLRSNRVYVGQRLKVPTKYNLRVYTVRRGDTLTQIARRFQTTLSQLMAVNSLKSGQIYPNQKLKIPTEG